MDNARLLTQLLTMLNPISEKMARMSNCNEAPVFTDGLILNIQDDQLRANMVQVACLNTVTAFNLLAAMNNAIVAVKNNELEDMPKYQKQLDEAIIDLATIIVSTGKLLGIDESIQIIKGASDE